MKDACGNLGIQPIIRKTCNDGTEETGLVTPTLEL